MSYVDGSHGQDLACARLSRPTSSRRQAVIQQHACSSLCSRIRGLVRGSFRPMGHIPHYVFRLSEDTLLTHCTSTAFASHRDIVTPNEQLESTESGEGKEVPKPKEWTGCPGRVVIFRWLGLNRFFPPAETMYRSIQRGCVSVSRVQ